MRTSATLALAMIFWLAQATGPQSQPVGKQKEKARPPLESSTTLMYLSESIVDPYVPWPTSYGVQQTGAVTTTFDCFGQYGRGFGDSSWKTGVPGWPEASFESPPGSQKEYLFGGALWIGAIVGSDTLVSTGVDSWSTNGLEFRPPHYPIGSVARFDYPTSFSMRALFTDTCEYLDPYTPVPHVPLNISVSQKSHVWRNAVDEDIVIYDLTITNIGDHHLEKVYVGHYMDADVGWIDHQTHHTDDLAGSLRELGIGYIVDNDGDPVGTVYNPTTDVRKILALKLLASSHPVTDTNFNWWISNSIGTLDFGPRLLPTTEDPYFDYGTGGLGTPEGDVNKYYILSHHEWDYDQVYTGSIGPDDPLWMTPSEEYADLYACGSDTKFLMSCGPFDILPGASVRLLFAMFTADNVHDFPLAAYLFLPDMPDDYIAALNFEDVLINSARTEERATYLLDPLMPVSRPYVAHHDADSAVVAWDPWVFDNVQGYEVYLSEIPDEWLPYPGIAAPWLRPQSLEHIASMGLTNQHKLPSLDPNKFYFVNTAHRSQLGIGSEGVPLMIGRPNCPFPPQPDLDCAYFHEEGSLRISFTDTTGWDIDHYRLYRCPDQESLENVHLPFYSDLIPPSLTPLDSFEVGGVTYYYFAMEPIATIAAGAASIEDENPVEGAYYVITAVDIHGFETDFSRPVQSFEIYPPTRDILVISGLQSIALTSYDTVRNFYGNILSEYDWDIYHVSDTINKYECDFRSEDCIKWQDFTRFKMTILDFESYEIFLTPESEERFNRIKHYILSGGTVAYFGSFFGMNCFFSTGQARYYEQETTLVEPYFGADSLFFHLPDYYCMEGLMPDVDSCFGFSRAEPTPPALPEIAFDTLRHLFTQSIYGTWWDKTPPSVTAFVSAENAEVIYRYRSRYPELSWLEGHPVGLRVHTESVDTYLFGFHLWYTQAEPAKQLVQMMLTGLSTGTDEFPSADLPESFALGQNYPNPFNPSTVVQFSLPRAAEVTLEIYNVLGQRVNTLIDGRMLQAGSHNVEWHSDNAHGSKVSSGIYFYRLRAGDRTATKKMMLLK